MSKKKQLLASIASTEARIQSNRINLGRHQHYFRQCGERHGVVLVAMLLPSFLLGWKMAKLAPKGELVIQFLRFSLITTLNYIQKQNL